MRLAALPTLLPAALLLLIGGPARAQGFPLTNTSFATAASFSIDPHQQAPTFGDVYGFGAIGQTYYFDFLVVQPAYIAVAFTPHDLVNYATGPLTLYNASLSPLIAATGSGSLFPPDLFAPGLYYLSFDETTAGYISAVQMPTDEFTIMMEASLPAPTTIPPLPPAPGPLIAEVPAGYSPAVPEASPAWLLLAGLPPALWAARRRRGGGKA